MKQIVLYLLVLDANAVTNYKFQV